MTPGTCFSFVANLLLTVSLATAVGAKQARDHLTEKEIDLIKEAQELDKRVDVFSKAVDRRLLVLGGGVDVATTKQNKKDAELWGDLPTGSRSELVDDIAKILDEAITNIDDVSTRDERNPLVPKALRKLAAEATKVVAQLKPLSTQAKNDAEVASFELLMENAQSILDAANKLPPPVDPKKEKSKNNKAGN
jgi:hypothetical protein